MYYWPTRGNTNFFVVEHIKAHERNNAAFINRLLHADTHVMFAYSHVMPVHT